MSEERSLQSLRELLRGTVHVHVEAELLKLLRLGRPLVVKAGFDPTRPDLHLGHTVLMNKMRQFQTLGHQVVFIVGDFTAQIGDPSGRSATRPPATREEIMAGAKSYAEQAFKILDPEKTKVVYNSEWLGRMGFDEVIRLAGKYTLARIMERADFKKRWEERASISIHELLYPLVQAYDSVVVRCDIELGGDDQLFNLMVGREIMREYGLTPQVVMTTPILEGLNAKWVDGQIVGDKMSKSLDNYVGIDEPADQQFGKLMSISDELMWRYYELLSEKSVETITEQKKACQRGELNPKTAKIALAGEIVARYHGAAAAEQAGQRWERQFSRKEIPETLREVEVDADGESVWLPKALALAGVVKSSTEGRRRVEQGAVEVDGVRITDPKAAIKRGARYIIRAGKTDWIALTVK